MSVYIEFYNNNKIFVILLFTILLLLILAQAINTSYKKNKHKLKFLNNFCFFSFPSIKLFNPINKKIIRELELIVAEEKAERNANILSLSCIILGVIIFFILKSFIFTTWYIKFLLVVVSFYIPFLSLFFILDRKRDHINKSIPTIIDEFRSCFIEHKRVIPAIKKTHHMVNNNISKLLFDSVQMPDMDSALLEIREKINNVWFNIFIALIVNYKENGGELTKQLYKLNNTLTREINVQKKKNKRLLFYEIFTLLTPILAVPMIDYMNIIIFGNFEEINIDNIKNNYLTAGLFISSLLGAIILRLLRKV